MTTDDTKQQVAIELLQPTRDYLFRVFLYHTLYYSCYSLYTHAAALPLYINRGSTRTYYST